MERFEPGRLVEHFAVEDVLPSAAVREDLERYKLISNRFPFLLNVAYRFPPLYMRKLFRERYLQGADLGLMERAIRERGARSVLCVSHRPAFWVGSLKRRRELDFELVGVLGEYGSSLGWRYVFWDQMNAFLSPVGRETLRFPIPSRVRFQRIALPARRDYERLADRPGDPMNVLVVCGLWGQGPIDRIVRELLEVAPGLEIHAVCGDNTRLFNALERENAQRPGVHVHGQVDSLAPLVERCGSVITKPGISTLLECHAAQRKVFLLDGMPVAEGHNMDHALAHFGAERYAPQRFNAWLHAQNTIRASDSLKNTDGLHQAN